MYVHLGIAGFTVVHLGRSKINVLMWQVSWVSVFVGQYLTYTLYSQKVVVKFEEIKFFFAHFPLYHFVYSESDLISRLKLEKN